MTLALEQGSQEWHEFRKNHIGSSDAPVIMGVSPWKTPYQLWEEKIGISHPIEANSYMQRGTNMEEEGRQSFELYSGIRVFPSVHLHDTCEWMSASVDGISADFNSVVEIKCPGASDHSIAQSGGIPPKYVPQLQHILAVTGLPMIYYWSYDGSQGVCVEVFRDDVYIEEMIQKEKEFWDCVQTLEAPELTDRDFTERSDDIWKAASSTYLEISKELKALEKKEKEAREYLISLAGNQNTKGFGVRLTKYVRKGNVDYSAIPELQDIDLEKYRKKSSESWRITNA